MKLRTLCVSMFLAVFVLFAGCSSSEKIINEPEVGEKNIAGVASEANADTGMNSSSDDSDSRASVPALIKSMELEYATEFKVDEYEDGYYEVYINDGSYYVLVPEGKPEVILNHEDISFIHIPCENIYLAASSAMDLFKELDCLDNIKSCSTKAADYSDSAVSERIESDEICYIGKYSAPDYERLVSLNTGIAIESTMIYHAPKVKEELESFGIPVLVERASYEKNPLGRLEWIKLYGVLMGKGDEAFRTFDEQESSVNEVIKELANADGNRPKVLFFYLSSNGYVNVRKPGDYVSKMIEIAGGEYAMDSLKIEEENALSTVNISWEDFYFYGKDADILIYNGTIDGGISSVDDLLFQNDMFYEFKSVKEDRVYCTNNNMYQEISKTGNIIEDLSCVIGGKEEELTYIRKVE